MPAIEEASFYESIDAPAFKLFTRNPNKLWHIVDFVLAHGAAVVTQNYVLAPGEVARRDPLLRPAHRDVDGER